MHKQVRYPIHKSTAGLMRSVGVSPERVLRRAGMPTDLFEVDTRGVTAQQFFTLWEAISDEIDNPKVVVEMAKAMARGPFIPAAFAFSCSPNIATGLRRKAVFKPLVAPIKLLVSETEANLVLEIDVAEPNLDVPKCMAAFEMVYFLEMCRAFTGVDFLPVEVGVPEFMEDQAVFDRHYGRKAVIAPRPRLTLTREDAYRPLISENPQLWAGFERELTRQLAERRRNLSMAVRVRNALLELLPAGQATVDAVSDRLVTSRRSLQRHLRNEGQTFQSVLDETRSDLSLHYLRQGDMSVEEISYLLAYRDPNSFYRAFQNWTGRTPAQMRTELL
ncbi:AraC family transcriptional regulator [Shimia sagamensis]|uniref:Transcriptional regulator, AraC family n=1 Tax=Shimia sagamensis TaxID=1566352 RepID=A0ABY1P6R4_9RHOB|nr:AraC family transcriptional regulator [Shimia sagamensis]SMP26838.1 transcriptional regulator, AraC family [Shimia sagamensis]